METKQDEREKVAMHLDVIAAQMLKGVKLDSSIKQEYAALSEIGQAAIRAAHRAVSACEDILDAKTRVLLVQNIAIEFIRLTVRRGEPGPQVVMIPAQGGGMAGPPLIGKIPGLS